MKDDWKIGKFKESFWTEIGKLLLTTVCPGFNWKNPWNRVEQHTRQEVSGKVEGKYLWIFFHFITKYTCTFVTSSTTKKNTKMKERKTLFHINVLNHKVSPRKTAKKQSKVEGKMEKKSRKQKESYLVENSWLEI